MDLIRHIGRAPELVAASRQTPAYGELVRQYLQICPVDYPCRIPLRGGGSVTCSSWAEVKVFWHIFVRGSYVLPADCETILDCGANIGIFSIWAARQRPSARIIAFEPFPDTFVALKENMRANHLDARVMCVPLALAARSGQRQIGIDGESPDRKMLADDLGPAAVAAVAVQSITLAEVLDRYDLPQLDFLKMDIEGSEWDVLLSTPPEVLGRMRHLQLEYHEVHARFGYKPDKLFAHVAAAGHRLTYRKEDALRTGMAYFERQQSYSRGH